MSNPSSTHNHLGMVFDTKLDFSLHLKNVQNKVNETTGLLHNHLGMVFDTKLDLSLHLKNVQNKVNETIGLLQITSNR